VTGDTAAARGRDISFTLQATDAETVASRAHYNHSIRRKMMSRHIHLGACSLRPSISWPYQRAIKMIDDVTPDWTAAVRSGEGDGVCRRQLSHNPISEAPRHRLYTSIRHSAPSSRSNVNIGVHEPSTKTCRN